MSSELDLFHELSFYTLGHPGPEFIHQHVVDAYAAQTATEETKSIAVVFGLIGLYLHLEHGFTGRQVQMAHMRLARQRKQWPKLALTATKGNMRVADVLAVAPGEARDAMIDTWCESVWAAWAASRREIAGLAKKELGVDVR